MQSNRFSRLILAFSFVGLAAAGLAACDVPSANEPEQTTQLALEAPTFVVVEQMPQLVGGIQSLAANLTYPEAAKTAGIEGKVFVQFVVDEHGRVENPVVVRGIGGGCDEAAVAAVRAAQFEPGRQKGEAVRVKMSIPIAFKLNGDA
ncbi:MAG: energy transducer TonB [Rhodothermales bacterium]